MKDLERDLGHLFDILYWIKRLNVVSKRNYEDPEDYKDLLCKNLENIGISGGKISDNTRGLYLYSKDEWKEIIGFRNISAHAYETISMKTVLDIVKNDIPEFKEKTSNIISSLIKENLENKKPVEFEFEKKIYSLEYPYPYNDKINIITDNDNFNLKTILMKNIPQVIDNIVNNKEF
ncbi:MAG: HepT-like ribonuclease domain-containing protein [bacterium]